MTANAVTRRQPAGRALEPRIRLSRTAAGNWTLAGTPGGTGEFTDFDTALRDARRVPGAKGATIEVWQGRDYICCLPPEEWPSRAAVQRSGFSDTSCPSRGTVERDANRAAQFMLPVVGLVFWLALLLLAFAASFGWRFALH
jgi:hypothetical protein